MEAWSGNGGPPSAARFVDPGRLAGAPISWGVCEVPGWGLTLPPDRVLAEMAALGLRATELGPAGYLPTDAAALRAALDAHGLRLVGGFMPVVLHEPSFAAPRAAPDAAARPLAAPGAAGVLAAAGADVFVAAAVVDAYWSPRVALDDRQWGHLVAHLAELERLVQGHGLTLALHPHAGTQVETAADVERVPAPRHGG